MIDFKIQKNFRETKCISIENKDDLTASLFKKLMDKESQGVIKPLLEKGADVNAKNNIGKTALDYAKDSATEEILKKAM